MNTNPENPLQPPRLSFLDLAVLILSIYVLAALLVQRLLPISPEVNVLLDQIDIFICFVFLLDFGVRFKHAKSKLAFMKWGWIDLLASIPAYDFLRWGRTFRLFRILRILRAFRSVRHIVQFLYRSPTRGLGQTAVLLAVLLILFSSIAVLSFEEGTNTNIQNSFDAVWWAISTMTTVGYGDVVPQTVEGKIVAMVLMVTGVCLFGVITGLFARIFLEKHAPQQDSDVARLAEELRLLRERIDMMEARSRAPSGGEPPALDSPKPER